MIARLLLSLALLSGTQSTDRAALDLDPRSLPHATAGRWEGFDPARMKREELPKGMLEVRDALQKEDLARALRGLQQVLRETPDFPPAWHQLGVLYFKLQRYGDGVACLERYLEVAPARVGDTRVLGHCYYSLGDYARAKSHYEKVLAVHPDEAEALRGHALALMRLGDSEAALKELERVIELAPRHVDAWTWKAQILFDLDRLEGALAAAEKARELDRFAPRAWFLVGRICTELGRDGDAESALRRFHELTQIEQRLRYVEERLQYQPGEPALWREKAELHRSAGDLTRLREALAHLFEAAPQSIESRMFGLDVLESLNDIEGARLVAKKLEELGAEDATVWRRLEQFYAHAQDRRKQIEAGERFRRLSAK